MQHNEESYTYDNIEVTGLTPRRREALALRASGLSYKHCAKIMGCSVDNVKNRIEDLYFEFRVNSTPQLMSRALKSGILRILTLMLAMHIGLSAPGNSHVIRTARTHRNSAREYKVNKC